MNEPTEQRRKETQHFVGGYGAIGGAMLGECGMRQNARAVIRDRIGQLRSEAARLEALLDALPAKLPPDADQALWDMAIAARRG